MQRDYNGYISNTLKETYFFNEKSKKQEKESGTKFA